MTTSASWNYSVTAAQIIRAALEDIQVVQAGENIDNDDFAVSLVALNLMVKQWQGTSDKFPGLKIWTRQRLIVFLASGQTQYLIGPLSTDDRSAVSYVATTLSAAKAANATSVSLTSTTGMTNGDQIGFVTDAGTLEWTTITTVGSPMTLPSNTVGAASSGKVVFAYTSKAQRFVDWESAVIRDNSNPLQPIDMPLEIYTDVAQYEAITQKNASGDPTAILIEPLRLSTRITTNFAAANTYKSLRLSVIYPSEDYDSASGADDIAYPQEYFAALEWELARRLAPKFGRPWSQDLQLHWQIAVQDGVNLNPDNTHLSFEPGRETTDVGSPFTRP